MRNSSKGATRIQSVLPGMAALEPPNLKKQATIAPPSEWDEQVALFTFLRIWQKQYPCLSWIYSSMNGRFTGYDSAAATRARRDVMAGLTKGVWDIHVPLSIEGCPGLWIEMKRKGGKLTPEQIEFGAEMRSRGYRTEVCYNWVEAVTVICRYANITDERIILILKVGK